MGLEIGSYSEPTPDQSNELSRQSEFSEAQKSSENQESQESFTPVEKVKDIPTQIQDLKLKMSMLEEKGMDELTDEEFDLYFGYEEKISELNNKQTLIENEIQSVENEIQSVENEIQSKGEKAMSVENEIQSVENEIQSVEDQVQSKGEKAMSVEGEKRFSNNESAKNLTEMQSYLSPSTLNSYPELSTILSSGDTVLQKIENKQQLTEADVISLKQVTEKALNYLKDPNNRQVLAAISRDLQKQDPAKFEQFKSFLIAQDQSFENIFPAIENTNTQVGIAFDGGDISKIDGDIIHGENGKVLDMSGNIPKLSLQGNDDLELSVGEINTEKTQENEKSIADLNTKIERNGKRISLNEKRIARFGDMISDFQSYDSSRFDNQQARDTFKDQLVAANPSFEDMPPEIDFSETGAEFLTLLVSYVRNKKNGVEQKTEVLRADTIKMQRDAGILAVRVESQKRMAKEKIKNKVQRVSSSRSHYESTASSVIMSKTQDLFARISESNPVVLESGETVTGFDIATFEITGSFSPNLGDSGAEDFRSQEIHIALMNKILGQEIIQIGSNGLPIFRMNDQIVDRTKAEAFIREKVGSVSFESQAIQDLFSVPQTQKS